MNKSVCVDKEEDDAEATESIDKDHVAKMPIILHILYSIFKKSAQHRLVLYLQKQMG